MPDTYSVPPRVLADATDPRDLPNLAQVRALLSADVAAPPWAANTPYGAGGLVWQGGQLYRRRVTGTSGASFDATAWDLIGPQSASGGGVSGFADVSLGTPNGSANSQTVSAGVFTIVRLNTVISNDGSAFDVTTFLYTVQQTGIHNINARVRPVDNTANGLAFGFGVHSESTDGAHFQWNVTSSSSNGGRSSFSYARQARFAANAQLRFYVFSSSSLQINNAGMSIVRLGS